MTVLTFNLIENNKSPVVAIMSAVIIVLCIAYIIYDWRKRRFERDNNGDLMIDIDLNEDDTDEPFIIVPFSVVPAGAMFIQLDNDDSPVCLLKLKNPSEDKNAIQIVNSELVKIEEDTLVAWFNEMEG